VSRANLGLDSTSLRLLCAIWGRKALPSSPTIHIFSSRTILHGHSPNRWISSPTCMLIYLLNLLFMFFMHFQPLLLSLSVSMHSLSYFLSVSRRRVRPTLAWTLLSPRLNYTIWERKDLNFSLEMHISGEEGRAFLPQIAQCSLSEGRVLAKVGPTHQRASESK